jgi:hypothetical protein
MSEGRTNAAQADVEGEDRPADAPASTGTTGAGDVSGSGDTSNGHGNGTGDTTGGATAGEVGDATTTSEDSTGSSVDADHERDRRDDTDGPTTPDATPGEGGSGEPETGATVPAATLPGDAKDAPASSPAAAADGDEDWADAEDKAYKKEMRKGFAFGAAGGIVIGAIVALLLGALVWPGYLLGPGDPQDTANQVTQALSSKDANALGQLSCKGPDGQPVTQLSPQVLQYITKVAPAGPTTTLIDTEARTPVDLTLSVQGQTQTLPSELVLGETRGDWCLKGLAQRQQ